MKVLFYSHTAKISGAENILLLLLEKLNTQKFSPSAICSGEGPLPETIRKMGIPCATTGELKARFTVNPFRLAKYVNSVFETAIVLRREIKNTKPDLVHANSIRAGIVATAATFGMKVPVFWHLQDELGTHPLSTLIRIFVIFSNRVRLIAASGATLESFRGLLLHLVKTKTPAAVVHNVVDSSKFDSDPANRERLRKEFDTDDGRFLLGTIGQITPRKGQLELIQAFAECVKDGLDAKLLIIGSAMFNSDHEYLTGLKREVEISGISDAVEFTGFRKDVPELLSALDSVVINSKSEAFVVVGVEGLAAGVPVIATDVGGIREMIEDGENGLVISFGDRSALKSAIQKLAGDSGLREKFAKRGREIVAERLNANVFIDGIEKFFVSSCLEKHTNQIQQIKGARTNA